MIPASEPPAAPRRALVALVLAVALFGVVVVQLTVVNRLPLPGTAEPDLVLLLVTAIAVATGPMTGALAGFAGGLAVDVAPPASHYAGEYALIFCLAGYAAARTVRAVWDTTGEHDAITSFTVMAVAAAAGEAGKAALGMLLSDPDVTGPVVSRVLPGAISYDLLLAPFAFLLVSRITRGAVSWNTAAARAPAPQFGRAQRLASVFRQAGVFRQASAGAAPNLRLAGTGGSHQHPQAARRVPRLRLSGASSPSIARTIPAFTRGAPFPLAGGRTQKLNFAGNLPPRAARRVVRTPGKNWLRTGTGSSAPVRLPARLAAKRAPRAPARGWLGSSRSAGPSWAGPSRAGQSRAGQSWAGAGRRRSPRRGWLGGPSRRRGTQRGNWYSASPSGAWLRRARHPWRKRRQRLLRLVGVGR